MFGGMLASTIAFKYVRRLKIPDPDRVEKIANAVFQTMILVLVFVGGCVVDAWMG